MLTLNVDEAYLTKLNLDVPINVPINAAQSKIFEALRRNSSLTAADLASLVGVTDKTIKRHIKVLCDLEALCPCKLWFA
jgi:DNA-binding MarR family transcriptional regulator